MVTHPSTNRVWRSATTLIEANALPLSQIANRTEWLSDSDDDVCRRRVNVLMICLQDEVELCSATAQFESFVLQFFDR